MVSDQGTSTDGAGASVAAAAARARRGTSAAPDPAVTLVAGSLRAELVGSDLRDVRWGGTEAVQRMYMAVRDAPWNTIPGRLLHREVVQGHDSFRVTFRQRHHFDEIEVEWEGLIEGASSGVLIYEMRATAIRDFTYSKIGLNIHHGLATYRGRAYRAYTTSGLLEDRLPADIEPQLIKDGSLTAMFDHYDRISFDLDGCEADFSFDGDRFEIQDHRNWSDANYKTYGTPLSYGFPRDIAAGDELFQRVTLRLGGEPAPNSEDGIVRVGLLDTSSDLPQIGHRLGQSADPARRTLEVAKPDHLRVEAGHEELAARLASARELVHGTATRIELVASMDPERPEPAIAELAELLGSRSDDVARVVVLAASAGFSEFKTATPPALPTAVAEALRARGVQTPVFSGTDQFFNELNRVRPDYSSLDGVAFALNPQVHASDDRSLMQNAATLPDIDAFCRRLYPSAAITVGPVHLLGPNGPFPGGPPTPGGLPPGLDPRHAGLFGAAWTVAFLQAATRARVDAVTLFDLVGPRGLAEHAEAADQVVGFPSTPGGPFPLLHVLSWLRDAQPGIAVHADGAGDRCAVVGVRGDRHLRLVVANLREEVADIRLRLGAPAARVRVLDEVTLAQQSWAPQDESALGLRSTNDGVLALLLRGYGVACVDAVVDASTGARPVVESTGGVR